jgi:SRSO17 transposase
MEAQREQGLEPPASGLRSGWSEVLAEIHARTAHRFVRAEVRERVGRYLVGLLDRVERKNSWQLAEALGETGLHGIQRLLNGAVWDAEGVRDDLRRVVVEHLADPTSGVLIVDETAFLKKGKHSCGVARQSTGTAGGTENAQVGVFLADASAKGVACIDRALYLPRAWTRDPHRRTVAGSPKQTRFATSFATKIALAKRMLARALDAPAPACWIVADSASGRSSAFRAWLEKRGRAYVVLIPKTTAVAYQGRRERAEQLGARIPEEAWEWISPDSPAQDGSRRVKTGQAPSPIRGFAWRCPPHVPRGSAAGCFSVVTQRTRATSAALWPTALRRPR